MSTKEKNPKLKKRNWAKNREILKSIPNPSKDAYEIKMKIPELTFEGVRGQPDFAHLYITFYPGDKVIELKSLKEYFFAFRSQIYSCERIINVVYDDMMAARGWIWSNYAKDWFIHRVNWTDEWLGTYGIWQTDAWNPDPYFYR